MIDVHTIGQYAAEFLRPELVVPADFRPTLRYGEEMEELEYLIRSLPPSEVRWTRRECSGPRCHA